MTSRRAPLLALAPALLASAALAVLQGCASSNAATAPPAAAPPAAAAPARPTAADTARLQALLEIAWNARQIEGRGDYAGALVQWRRLRPQVALDGDVELAMAIDEARTGQLDSAAARLAGPTLSRAALDTLPVRRYRIYPTQREGMTINGTFDGWHWYVWRARAEVSAARGRWDEATIAARRCVEARPMNGTEWLLRAVCAGRAGHADEARAAAREAARLSPALPEARYLAALWAWKDGRRTEAQEGFRAAVAADSAFQPAVVALLRARMPGSAPDTLPATVLAGPRAVGMLTSPASPKIDDELAVDQVPILAGRAHPARPDSLIGRQVKLWLYIDAQGRVALVEPAWYPPASLPTAVVAELMALVPGTWRFLPASEKNTPRPMWVDFNYLFQR